MGKFYDTVIFFITPDPSWLVALLESLIGTLLYGPNVPYQSLQNYQTWVMPNEKIEFKKSTRTGIERNQSEESMHTTGRTNMAIREAPGANLKNDDTLRSVSEIQENNSA